MGRNGWCESTEMGSTQQNQVHSLWPGEKTQGTVQHLAGGGSGQQGLHSNHSSFLRQAPSQGPLSPVEVCDSWGSSRRGIPLYPTGEGRHLPLSPYTSSCHVLGHQCFKIYWFLAGCLLKNQKTSSFKFIPTAFALTSRQSIPVQTAPRRSRPTVDSLFHISS